MKAKIYFSILASSISFILNDDFLIAQHSTPECYNKAEENLFLAEKNYENALISINEMKNEMTKEIENLKKDFLIQLDNLKNEIKNSYQNELNSKQEQINNLNNRINSLNVPNKLSCYSAKNNGSHAGCNPGYIAVSCSCGSGCGSYHIEAEETTCHCECGEWTRVECCLITN